MPRHVFAYGSLLCSQSRALTVGRTTELIPAGLVGYRRIWNMPVPQLGGGICFLAIEPAADALCSGGVFTVDEAEFDRVVQRERDYTVVSIEPSRLHWEDQSQTLEGPVHSFIHRSDERPTPEFPIVQSYLDLCLRGCLELDASHPRAEGRARVTEFLQDAHGWSEHWINDRVHPRRPFVEEPNAPVIDHHIRANLAEYVEHIRIGG